MSKYLSSALFCVIPAKAGIQSPYGFSFSPARLASEALRAGGNGAWILGSSPRMTQRGFVPFNLFPNIEPRVGIEPTTYALRMRCSAIEPPRPGAGDGNRTHALTLGRLCSAIILHPLIQKSIPTISNNWRFLFPAPAIRFRQLPRLFRFYRGNAL
jgi:hypothetical protein